MTTPRREAIYEEAKRLYFEHEARSGQLCEINPTSEELLESGFTHVAVSNLMSNPETIYGITKTTKSKKEELKTETFDIDVEEALRSGVFIAGGKGTTKSNLAKTIVHKLMLKGVVVKVFDISKVWLRSSVPYFFTIKGSCKITNNLYDSVVYDLSRLTPRQAKRFIGQVLEQEWSNQVNLSERQRKWIVYVFEECQMLIPQGQLRSYEAQQVLRVLTVGRNYQIGYLAVTQRPALADTSVFELTYQKFFSRMDGQNDLRKVSAYVGDKAYDLEKLGLGEFLYDKGNTTKKICTSEFRSQSTPQELDTVSTIHAGAKPRAEVVNVVLSLASAFVFFLILLVMVM